MILRSMFFILARHLNAVVINKLMHDIETNPGPCTKGPCPGANILGRQSGLHSSSNASDPLERLFTGSTYTFGGSD